MSACKLVVANWKMHGSLESCHQWMQQMSTYDLSGCDVALCAPSVYLTTLVQAAQGTPVRIGAEDVNENAQGAFTGEISAGMLADIGCHLVIVGHSERRTMYGDTDERVALKAQAALSCALAPIVCVGETLQERQAGQTMEVVTSQLQAVIDLIGVQGLSCAVLAYEPVWAIGTGLSATPEQAQEVHAALRAFVAKYDAQVADQLRILYGGSVKPGNAAELFAQPDIDGGLIGGASLKAEDFWGICQAAKNV